MTFETTRSCRRRVLRVATVLLIASPILLATDADGQDPPPEADFGNIVKLLRAGDYVAAEEAASKAEAAIRPASVKDTNYLPRARACIDFLVARAIAARRMGKLDSAEAALAEAEERYGDKDFQRTFNQAARGAGANAMLSLGMVHIEMLDLRTELALDRFEAAGGDAKAAVLEPLVGRVEQGLQDSASARQRLAKRLEKADPGVLQSTYVRVLAGTTRPSMFAARLATARARRTRVDPAKRDGAVALLATAATELENGRSSAAEGIAAALGGPPEAEPQPADAGAELSEPQQEAALVWAELLGCQAETSQVAGDLPGARKAVERALAFRRSAQRADHPDLVKPLILAAAIVLDEATAKAASGPPEATDLAAAADLLESGRRILTSSDRQFDADSPARSRLAKEVRRLAEAEAAREKLLAGGDAAEAAATRAGESLQAIATGANPPAADPQ